MSNQFEDLLGKMNEADGLKGETILNVYKTVTGSRTGIPEEQVVRKDGRYVHRATGEDVVLDKEASSGSAIVDEAGMFVADRIENLEAKIKALDTLAKGTRKGLEQSHIYTKIDAFEAELTKARIEADV